MKNPFTKILSTMLVLCLLFGIIPSFAADASRTAPLDYSARSNGVRLAEETTLCIADSISLERAYAPNRIIVTLKHTNSRINADAKKSWFAGMGIAEVNDLTARNNARNNVAGMSIEQYEIAYEFHQVLLLTLDESSKANVVETIRQLEQLDFVLSAEPDYPTL